ncbi:MAG: glycosyltransferase involved in cell wall biosynthesis [Crocinitomix sp.]|jgi:glycosyltransferase involved in cell wall biosynthesis
MKIVFDARVHLNYFSGISRYIICLLEAYAQEFPEDELIVLLNPTIQKDNSIYKTLNGFSNLAFKIIDAGHMGPKNYTKMGRIIKLLNPDVYHYPHLDAPVFTGKVPVVATVHDSNSNATIKKFDDKFGLKSIYFKQALKTTLKKANRVVFVSDSIKNEILNIFKLADGPKFSRIYNGFEENFNQISAEDRDAGLQAIDLSKPYILFVGQIREHKNIYRVVEAFKRFSESNPTYQLIIVGHNYLNLALNENNIQHIDRVSNKSLKALYSACTSFLFPSLFEGFGFPILEAMSYGKPVITTNYGATAEVAGEHAILVNPESVTEITAAIVQSIQPNGNAKARMAHTQQFSWKSNAQEIRKVYLEAIADN